MCEVKIVVATVLVTDSQFHTTIALAFVSLTRTYGVDFDLYRAEICSVLVVPTGEKRIYASDMYLRAYGTDESSYFPPL